MPSTQVGGLQAGHAYYHSGSHENYTTMINARVARIENRYNARITAGMKHHDAAALAKSELTDLQTAAYRMLNKKNGGTSCSRLS